MRSGLLSRNLGQLRRSLAAREGCLVRGRRLRQLLRSVGAGCRALQEERALALISGERCRAFELDASLGKPAELLEEIAAHARQQVIAPERGLGGQCVDEL